MIPIHLGITGHRDLLPEEIPAIKSKLCQLIEEYKILFTNTRFLMITMLAEGADRVAAEAAIECGIGLIAVSPMPLYEYEKDFSDENSLFHFRVLWNRAVERIELPFVNDNKSKANSLDGVNRELQYASGGAFLASNSQILIALWDGIENEKLGGTAYVVKSKLSGDYLDWKPNKRNDSPLSIPDCGPVYHIEVKRVQNAGNTRNEPKYFPFKASTASGITVIFPETWLEIAQKISNTDNGREGHNPAAVSENYFLEKILLRIDQFNHDSSNTRLISSDDIEKNSEQLYPSQHLTRGQQKLLELYGASDSLAIEFQKKTVVHLKGIAIFSFLAFAMIGIFDQFLFIWLYGLFWCFIVAALAFYFVAKKNKCEDKFYDYRALAEGLRVQLSWLIAGIPENVTDHYLEKYTEKIPWLLVAISNCSMSANHEPHIKPQMALVRSNWVDNQYSFYSDRISKKEALVANARNWSAIFVSLALFFIAAVGGWGRTVSGFAEFKQLTITMYGYDLNPYAWLIYGVTFCVALAGVRTFVAEKRALQDEASQYRRMEQKFSRGWKRLNDLDKESNKDKEKCDVLRELGKEALTENGDWLLYQRSKPLEMRWG